MYDTYQSAEAISISDFCAPTCQTQVRHSHGQEDRFQYPYPYSQNSEPMSETASTAGTRASAMFDSRRRRVGPSENYAEGWYTRREATRGGVRTGRGFRNYTERKVSESVSRRAFLKRRGSSLQQWYEVVPSRLRSVDFKDPWMARTTHVVQPARWWRHQH